MIHLRLVLPTTRAWPRRTALVAAVAVLLAGCASAPTAPGSATAAAFWPPFPAAPRIQYLASYRYSEDVEPARSALDELITGSDRQVLPIVKPYGVAMWDGKIYVCDTKNAGVVVLDVRNQQTRLMGVSGAGRLTSPTDVAISADGVKYVSDAQRGVVMAYDADERIVATFGFTGFRPTGVAVRGGELYVCDFESRTVHVLDRFTGDRLRVLGEQLAEEEQMAWPLGIDVDPAGNVYVSDVLHCRVRKFAPDGTLLNAFGTIGTNPGNFVRPKHLAVDSDGIVYVVDAGFANVQLFDDSNRLLMFFGSAGAHPGAMQLPAGVCVHDGDLDLYRELIHPDFQAERLVLVTNQFGPSKVSVYAMGQLRPGVTPRDITAGSVPVPTGLSESPDDPLGLPGLVNPDESALPTGPPGGGP
ncbi:MAG: hypothetical protein HKO59_16170 [Phycisphaerales bacterium]|nr:hypothetical protein [Phycisphaerae bacterium]NNF42922.1 hypothetical protein [Phycisphaerales bacterium]NNM27488.1 hypothetical protein [Phycisphaerales bacterium]